MKLFLEQGRTGQVRARLEGNLDVDTVPEARKQLLRIARKVRLPALDIDFSSVSSLDTSAVALMVEVLQVLSQTGHKLRLTGLRADQKRLFTLARLNHVFCIDSESRECV